MQDAFLVIGLGNPGRKYEKTRHNAGFLAAERICKHWDCDLKFELKFESTIAKAHFEDQIVLICQPQTFMNASGKAVGKLAHFYKIERRRMLVLVDDADLPLGEIRLRQRGSSGGHNGLKSIAEVLQTQEYARLRIGIGREGTDLHDHVLGTFEAGERDLLNRVLERVKAQVQMAMKEGFEAAMNRYNGRLTNLTNED